MGEERETYYLPSDSPLIMVNTMLACITGWDLRWRMTIVGNSQTFRLVVINNKRGD